MKDSECRPCLVGNNKKHALLHMLFVKQWTHGASATIGGFTAGQESHAFGLVEYEDGTLDTVNVENIHMLDSDSFFWKNDSRNDIEYNQKYKVPKE